MIFRFSDLIFHIYFIHLSIIRSTGKTSEKTQAKGLARQAAIAPLLERMKRERGPLGWKKTSLGSPNQSPAGLLASDIEIILYDSLMIGYMFYNVI